MTSRHRLTDTIVRNLPLPVRGNRIEYDAVVRGFGIRLTAAGARAFVLTYRRKADGLQRRLTIGAHPDWNTVAAREEAKRLKRDIDGGRDPVGDAQTLRAAPTVTDLAERFLLEHVAKQQPQTQLAYRTVIVKDILPALGGKKVAAVEFEHVERLHAAVSKQRPVQANRMLAVLAKMFALAVKWKLRLDNPCKGIERNREHQRRRYLRPDELARLTAALAADPNQQVADMFRLLLLTGARKDEVRSVTWDHLDLTTGVWTKPHTMTKQRTEHAIPLSAPARQLLSRLYERRAGEPWVFPGRNGKSRQDLKYVWARICKAAGISGLRIHDLRHSYASQLVSSGFSLPVIGALLGHTTPATTHRYAHLFDDPLREATERVGAIVAGKPTAKVVTLK